jgi:hypothetical protein
VLEGRSLNPRTMKSQEGASSVKVRIFLLLNAHTVAMMMMIRRARRRTRRKRRRRRTR